jgi:aquaporin Z
MTDRPPEAPLSRKLFAEVLGTFFVTLVPAVVDILYYTTGHVEDLTRWLARGFAVTAVIYSFSEISGAHVDPAVSLGFAVRGVMAPRKAALYVVAQFAGAFGACALIWLKFGPAIALGAIRPGPGQPALHALVAEIVLTFFLMTVILATADAEFAVGKQAALAVGFTVAVCGFIGGPISGASMNPARSIAPQIVGGLGGISWIYLVGPCAGALLAAIAAPLTLGPPDRGEREAAEGG